MPSPTGSARVPSRTCPGRHEHRAPGEGDVDFPAVLGALTEVGYAGLVSLELSRDAHRADTLVPAALAALRAAEHQDTAPPS
ncbi:TIM barrel protein [Micromonospora sp. M12]